MLGARGLGEDILIYAVGTLAQRAVIFFLIPLYTNVLGVANYGLLETVVVTGQILIFAMDIGMSRSVLRYYSRYQDDPRELGKLFTTALSLMVLSGMTVLAAGVFAQEPLSVLLFGDRQFIPLVVWVLIVSLFQTLNLWIFSLFRARRESIKYVLVSGVNLVSLVTLNIVFVRYLQWGVLGVLWAQALVYLSITVIFFPEILKVVLQGPEFEWQLAKQLFNFGFPLIFTMSGMLIISTVDRYFLVHYQSLHDVAIYSLGVRISAILSIMIVTPFQLAWGPFLFGKEKENIQRLVSRVLTYLLLAMTLGGAVFLFFGRELILFMSTEDFLVAQKVLPLLLVSVALTGLYYWAASIVHLEERTWILGLVVFIGGLCNIGLNFLLTPHWSWIGAAWANVVSKSLVALVTLGLSMYYSRIRFERRRLVSLGLLLIGLWALHFIVLNSLSGLAAVGARMAALAFGLFLLWGPMQFFGWREQQRLREAIVTAMHPKSWRHL